MTPKSLFNIILKIFGLLFLREIIYTALPLINLLPFFARENSFGIIQNNYEPLAIVSTLAVIAIYSFITYLLIIKTNNIINTLRLDKGFNQETFSFNISSSLVLTIALIVTGGIILVNEIPNFCKNVFAYFQERSLTHGMIKPNFSYIIISAVKIIIALLLIGERQRIIGFVQKRHK